MLGPSTVTTSCACGGSNCSTNSSTPRPTGTSVTPRFSNIAFSSADTMPPSQAPQFSAVTWQAGWAALYAAANALSTSFAIA